MFVEARLRGSKMMFVRNSQYQLRDKDVQIYPGCGRKYRLWWGSDLTVKDENLNFEGELTFI
jgi:hypothetical protein